MITPAARLLWTLSAGLALAAPVRAQLFADFETTLGTFTVELFHEDVPRTVANFVSLAEGSRPWIDARDNRVRRGVPFYDGIIFHRVAPIPTLIIQAGSPKGDGSDGPGYKFPDEFTKDAAGQLLHRHVTGVLSMANSGAHTNGSQFFLIATGAPLSGLDDRHTVFGRVAAGPAGTAAQGQAVVDAISQAPRVEERPEPAIVIQKVAIRRVGEAATAFDPLAWQLPVVGIEREPDELELVFDASGRPDEFHLSYKSLIHRAYTYDASADLKTWTRLRLGTATTTAIRTVSDIRAFTYSDLNGVGEQFIRVREIDYSDLIARTQPPLSGPLSLRLKFTTPSIEVTLTRSGGGGSWAVTGPPAASGQLATANYPLPNGDRGFFSPVLGVTMTNPMPWTTGVQVNEMYVLLTFNAGSMTEGYFVADAYTTATPSVLMGGRGVFSVVTP
jgi:cyclophilin family peptidyl-prolyl cis-trans isomerase